MDNQKQTYLTAKTTRPKQTQADRLSKIKIKVSEESRMKVIFNELCALQEEKSSDEDSREKLYKKKIEERANSKKMKVAKSEFVSKTSLINKKATQKKVFTEEDDLAPKDKGEKKRKFGIKALRKTMRFLCDEYIKEDLQQMIWEVDEDSDGYIGENEFVNMYKRAVFDAKEDEPKKLFYLIEFLMFDKEQKHYITIEDTLEILCVRNPSKIDAAIDNIFNIDEPGPPNPKASKKKRETMTYIEYSDRMHDLSMSKRTLLNNRKKIFCDNLKEEVIKQQNN